MEGPILRGVVKFLDDGRAVWEGSWGYTRAAFEENNGQLNHFRYVCAKHAQLTTGDIVNFKGHFEVHSSKNKSKSQFSEKKFEIEMLEGEENLRMVRGTGANRFGNFVLVGKFDISSQILEVTRTYSKPDPSTLKISKEKKGKQQQSQKQQKRKSETLSLEIPQALVPTNPADDLNDDEYEEDLSYLPGPKIVLEELRLKDNNKWFSFPVDAKALGLRDYYGIVSKPMDLSTVQLKINQKKYSTDEDCFDDMRLIFFNALMYNPRGSPVYRAASDLSAYLEQRTKSHSSKVLSIGKRNRVAKKFYEPGEDDDLGTTTLVPNDEMYTTTEKKSSTSSSSLQVVKVKGKRGRHKKQVLSSSTKTGKSKPDYTAAKSATFEDEEEEEDVNSFDELDLTRNEEDEDFVMTPPSYPNDNYDEEEEPPFVSVDSEFHIGDNQTNEMRNLNVSPIMETDFH